MFSFNMFRTARKKYELRCSFAFARTNFWIWRSDLPHPPPLCWGEVGVELPIKFLKKGEGKLSFLPNFQKRGLYNISILERGCWERGSEKGGWCFWVLEGVDAPMHTMGISLFVTIFLFKLFLMKPSFMDYKNSIYLKIAKYEGLLGLFSLFEWFQNF